MSTGSVVTASVCSFVKINADPSGIDLADLRFYGPS